MAFERRNDNDGFGIIWDDDKKSSKKKAVKETKPKETKPVPKPKKTS
jgi:hypothetical protein